MNQITVVAAAGLKVPMAGKPHEYIDDKTPVAVDDAAYYRRCIGYGDLQIVTEPKTVKGSK